jgi:hypothetical protein
MGEKIKKGAEGNLNKFFDTKLNGKVFLLQGRNYWFKSTSVHLNQCNYK